MRFSVRGLFNIVPIFVPTLVLSRACHRVADGVGLRMDVAPGRSEIAVPGEVGQRIWVHVLGPPRQAGVPECIERERLQLGQRIRFGMLFFQRGLFDMPARSRRWEYPFTFASRSAHLN